MAIRTTPALVQDVLGRDYDFVNTPSLVGYIAAANAVVNRIVICAANKEIILSTTEQQLIETWLTAHFYACSDKPYQSKSTAGASASFSGQTAMGFDATLYGQTAMRLDPSNCLRNLDKQQVATAAWLGKAPSEQIDYKDRD